MARAPRADGAAPRNAHEPQGAPRRRPEARDTPRVRTTLVTSPRPGPERLIGVQAAARGTRRAALAPVEAHCFRGVTDARAPFSLALAFLSGTVATGGKPAAAAPGGAAKKGPASGGSRSGPVEALTDIFEVLCTHGGYRPVLAFSLAAQLGNQLFAGHISLFLKFVASCNSPTVPHVCVGEWCLVPAVTATQQRTVVVVAFYVAAFSFGPAVLAKARKHGVARVLTLEFGCYALTLLW